MTLNKKTFEDFSITYSQFTPCVEDGIWLVSRRDATHTNTGKAAIYIFGADAVEVTLHDKSNPNLSIDNLAESTMVEHIEKDTDGFAAGTFRFEFDGERFNFCKDEPKWASYDCGIWE